MHDRQHREISSLDNQNTSPKEKAKSLRKKVKHGSIWIISSHVGSQTIRFLSNLIMTRLLFTEAFGMMAIVTTFLVGLTLFSDIGIGPSIIQNKKGEDPEFYNTAWTIQIGRGFILFMVALVGSVPFSMFYGEPMLAKLISVAALNTIILGFASTKLFTSNRNLDIKRLAIIELLSHCTGLTITVLSAIINRSIWALVIGWIATSATKTILSHTILPGAKNHLHWNKADAQSLFRFGRWIFVSTMITFFAQQSDRLMFGKMIPFSLLGIYHIGNTLGNIPLEALRRLMSMIFFPLFSRIDESKENLHSIFIKTRWVTLVVAGWAFSGLIAGGTSIVEVLFDDRYLQAGWIVQFISIGCWFSISTDSYGAILLSKAKTLLLAMSNATKFISMILFIHLGNKYFGFQGAVIGIAGSEFLRLLFISIVSARKGFPAWHQDLFLGVMVASISIVVRLLDIYLAGHGINNLIRIIVIFILVSLFWSPMTLKVYKGIIQKRI